MTYRDALIRHKVACARRYRARAGSWQWTEAHQDVKRAQRAVIDAARATGIPDSTAWGQMDKAVEDVRRQRGGNADVRRHET